MTPLRNQSETSHSAVPNPGSQAAIDLRFPTCDRCGATDSPEGWVDGDKVVFALNMEIVCYNCWDSR